LIIADKTNKMQKQIRKINQQPVTSVFLGNQGCISQHNGQKKNQKRALESGLGYQNYDSPYIKHNVSQYCNCLYFSNYLQPLKRDYVGV
jgi:hypothetical protein